MARQILADMGTQNMDKTFLQVDAFSTRPLFGNPAAVVFDADDLSADLMQRIAREMNLSETVFLLRPTTDEADYRVRIFTPASELPFAGHPTIAAAHAVLDHYPDKAAAKCLKQECGIGIVPVEVLSEADGRRLRMTQAVPQYRATSLSAETMVRMLGCASSDLAETPFEVVSTGIPWLIVQMASVEALSVVQPDHGLIAAQCRELKAVGITVFAKHAGGPVQIRVRSFAPGDGIPEDPVCGSGNGAVAAYRARYSGDGLERHAYLAEQGIEIGRDGQVYASWERREQGIEIRIGGGAVTIASGHLHLGQSGPGRLPGPSLIKRVVQWLRKLWETCFLLPSEVYVQWAYHCPWKVAQDG